MFLLAQALPAASAPEAAPSTATEPGKVLSDLLRGNLNHSTAEWLGFAEHYGLRALLVLVLLFAAWTIAGWAASAVRLSLRRLKFDETLTLFFAKFVKWGLLLLAGLSCLSTFGVETTSFAAVIGAAGFAVGLAFQGTLANFSSGAMLLIFRPFKVGDVVNIAGMLGKVAEIELFTTAIDTFDNRRIIIPNSEIYGAVIENITFHPKRRIDVDLGVSYAAPIDHTRQILTEAAQAVAGVLPEPEPAVILMGLGASSVDWSVRVWGPTSDFLAIKQALTREVKNRLDQAEIEIPFPQMDIHVRSGTVS